MAISLTGIVLKVARRIASIWSGSQTIDAARGQTVQRARPSA